MTNRPSDIVLFESPGFTNYADRSTGARARHLAGQRLSSALLDKGIWKVRRIIWKSNGNFLRGIRDLILLFETSYLYVLYSGMINNVWQVGWKSY